MLIYNIGDWKNINQKMQKKDLFYQHKIFFITIYESQLSLQLKQDIKKIKKNNKDIIQIFCFPNLYYTFSCKNFFINAFKSTGLIINNSSSYIQNIKYWINKKIKKNEIDIDQSAKIFLLENNFTNIQNLANFLEKIILLYPREIITIKKIQEYYNTNKIFDYYDWIHAIVNLKKKKSIFILRILKKQKYDYLILISAYKELVYILLYLKEKKAIINNYINFLISQKKIINMPLRAIIKKNNIHTIQLALKILKYIEICLQNEQTMIIWMHLKTLSILLS